MRGLAGQIAVAVIGVAIIVGLVLTIGTLAFASMSFAQLMVDHGETLAAAQAMFQESVASFFLAALGVAAIASVALAIFIGRRVPSPPPEVSDAAEPIAQDGH